MSATCGLYPVPKMRSIIAGVEVSRLRVRFRGIVYKPYNPHIITVDAQNPLLIVEFYGVGFQPFHVKAEYSLHL